MAPISEMRRIIAVQFIPSEIFIETKKLNKNKIVRKHCHWLYFICEVIIVTSSKCVGERNFANFNPYFFKQFT